MTSQAYNVPQRYVSLEKQGQHGNSTMPPPYYGHQVPPRHHSHRSRGGCGCLRLFCCCCGWCRCCLCTIFIFIFLSVGIVVALYYLFKPIIPTYNVENLDVKAFDLQSMNKISSDIVVVVKAENPNEGIGLQYLENEVTMIYLGTEICRGQFPPFLQPGKNTTLFNVDLKGETEFDAEKQHQLMQDQKEGHIPLLITVKIPIRLVIDDIIHLRKVVVNVNCSVVIDQLQPNKKPNILKKDFTYGVEF
ncbi:NDR1/HIN1-like protein 6 [Lotus japonicus]|uniref:NDR1/HIN1-like protein 6 n=1 Tax=Lotus japonicus TaxID=34305 RepID=UPI002585DB1F|nr:NDR1/HIN1-like protein 6 [Lotus japonicus]